MNCLNDMANMWASTQSRSEAEAFENAIKRIKPEERIAKLEEENAELRQQINNQSDQIRRLREALCRGQEEYYE